MIETLRQTIRLPEPLGHPEMRRLPDKYGILHCPACGAEVLPVEDGHDPQTLNFHYESTDCDGDSCLPRPPVPDSPRR